MTTTTDHPLYGIGAEPVSADQPCGENVRYESEFEQLESELAKQESLSAETVDWKVVADLSSGIIGNSSKDLLVGAYLCNALLTTEGYTGLAVGLNILGDMVANHWDCLFPPAKRMRARATAFTWLAEKAGEQMKSNPPTVADALMVIECADRFKQLDGELVEKMGDQAPMLSDLGTPLKNLRRSAEAEAAKVEQAAAEPAPAPAAETPQANAPAAVPAAEAPRQQAAPEPAPSPQPSAATPAPAAASKPVPAPAAAAPAGALESETDSKKLLRQLQATIRDVAAFWIAQKLSDARAYRLARVAAWMVIDNAPPDNNGVTQINPPAPERLKFFESRQSEPAALIPELEKTLARSPFWLDGHFLVVQALRQLGAEHAGAVTVVINELGGFLARLPGVVDLSFADESPFAGDQTRLWLDAEVLGRSGAADSPTPGGDAGAEAWNQALDEATRLAAGGKSDDALALMNAGITGAAQLRDQVYWRCSLAELLLHSGKAGSACAILESLSRQAESRQVAEWEPHLLSKIYTLLFQCYQKLQKSNKDDPSFRQKADQAFEQLCWLDPVTALSVKGG